MAARYNCQVESKPARAERVPPPLLEIFYVMSLSRRPGMQDPLAARGYQCAIQIHAAFGFQRHLLPAIRA